MPGRCPEQKFAHGGSAIGDTLLGGAEGNVSAWATPQEVPHRLHLLGCEEPVLNPQNEAVH